MGEIYPNPTVKRVIFQARFPNLFYLESKIGDLQLLVKVRTSFFNNPYLARDLTELNRLMLPQYAVRPKAWENMDAEEKTQRLAQGKMYTCMELFIYKEHTLLPLYELGNRKTGCYMIDFRAAYKLNCD